MCRVTVKLNKFSFDSFYILHAERKTTAKDVIAAISERNTLAQRALEKRRELEAAAARRVQMKRENDEQEKR